MLLLRRLRLLPLELLLLLLLYTVCIDYITHYSVHNSVCGRGIK